MERFDYQQQQDEDRRSYEEMRKHEDCLELLCGCMLREHKGYPPCPDRCQLLEDSK